MNIGKQMGPLARRIYAQPGNGWRRAYASCAVGVFWGVAWLPGADAVMWTSVFLLTLTLGLMIVRYALYHVVAVQYNLQANWPRRSQNKPWKWPPVLLILCSFYLPRWILLQIQMPILSRSTWNLYAHTPQLESHRENSFFGLYFADHAGAGGNGMSIGIAGSDGWIYFYEDRETAEWKHEVSPPFLWRN